MQFENLDVWKRSSRLSADIYKELARLRNFGFKYQITRSGLSIPSNIAEGLERESNKEKLRFLDIAKSSCAELVTQPYIGMVISYIPKQVGSGWVKETKQIAAMFAGLKKSIAQALATAQELVSSELLVTNN